MSMEVHVLASGSDGNSTVVTFEETSILIDAGLSGKKLVNRMGRVGFDPHDIDAILITHEHSDHVKGAGVLSRRFDVPVYGNPLTLMNSKLGKVSKKVEFKRLEPFHIDDMEIRPLKTSHKAADPTAFCVIAGGKRFLLATDTGKITKSIEVQLGKADMVILEANYDPQMLADGPYPIFLKRWIDSDIGHLSNEACGAALRETRRDGRRVFLGHLSENNNTPCVARETVADVIGCRTDELGCLDDREDVRSFTL